MSDTPTPAPEGSAPTDGGQPEPTTQQTPTTEPTAQPQQPQGVPQADYDRLKARVSGQQHMIDPLREAGITDPNQVRDLLEAQRQVQAFRDRGVDLNGFLNPTAQTQPQQQPDDEPMTRGSFQQEMSMFYAQQQQAESHEQAEQNVMNQLKGIANELGGENAGGVWDMIELEAKRRYATNGRRYEPGHAMEKTAYVPLDAADIEAVKQTVTQRLAEIRGAAVRQNIDPAVTQQAQEIGNPNTGVEPAKVDRRQRMRDVFNERLQKNLRDLSGDSVSNS